jgi:hypothetical protein
MKNICFPIFAPFLVWYWALIVFDALAEYSRPTVVTGPSDSNIMGVALAFLMIFVAGFLQISVGWPSRVFLSQSASVWAHLGVGVGLSVMLTYLASRLLAAPRLENADFKTFSYLALLFVPPFLLGYFWLHASRHRRGA